MDISVEQTISSLRDPRVDERFIRTVRGGPGRHPLVLVGVVHDHPASVARVTAVCEAIDPGVVGLEVPPVAIPYYRRCARGTGQPAPGGEMTAAIASAPEARAVGIDAPNGPFVRRFSRDLLSGSCNRHVAIDMLSPLGAMAKQALACRVAASAMAITDWSITADDPLTYDDCPGDPKAQADHERRTVSQSNSFLRAVQLPAAMTSLNDLREELMAGTLDELRITATTVGIVGLHHLESIDDQIRSKSTG